jgi:RNA polymerase sigma-70 factor (ECF subfamily)
MLRRSRAREVERRNVQHVNSEMFLSDHEERWASAMRAANGGCARSYAALLEELAAVLRRVAMRDLARLGFGASDVEDVVQETLLAIHLKRHTWSEQRPFIPWLRAIARHKTIDCVRRRRRTQEVPIDGHENVAPAVPSERVTSVPLDRYLAELPPRQRAVVEALGLNGENVEQAARKLNISNGAVRVALHRGLAALAAKFGGWVP